MLIGWSTIVLELEQRIEKIPLLDQNTSVEVRGRGLFFTELRFSLEELFEFVEFGFRGRGARRGGWRGRDVVVGRGGGTSRVCRLCGAVFVSLIIGARDDEVQRVHDPKPHALHLH
jgi:hypothetical protein